MNVDSDCTRRKTKIRLAKRTARLVGAPSIIKRAIGHWITIRKKCRRIFVNDWHANFVKLHWNFREPSITDRVASGRFMHSIDVDAAPESFLFGGDRIDDHPSDGFSCRCVKPADE